MKTKIIIAIVILLLIAGSVWYYFNFFKPAISLENIDYLKKKVDYQVIGGGKRKRATQVIDQAAEQSQVGKYSFKVFPDGDALYFQMFDGDKLIISKKVDFKTQTSSEM